MKRICWLFALLLWTLPAWGEPGRVKVNLLHLNDVYEYTTVDDGRKGSFPRIETLRQRERQRNPNTIFVLAGDTLSPSVASSLFRGKQMIAMWNAVGLDLAVLGNHEFDFGSEVLRERIKESKFTWLAANVMDKRTGKRWGDTPEFVVREVGGVKIGFFGVIVDTTGENSNPGPEVEFLEPIGVAKEVVAHMREQGVQVVVALTHVTLEDDKRLARAVPIDLILGGHEHVPLYSLVGKTPIFKWGSDARILGQVEMELDASTGKILEMNWKGISVGKSIPSDARVQRLVKDYEAQLSRELDIAVAENTVELDGLTGHGHTRETNLGNFVADVQRAYYQSDVALVPGGAVRINRLLPPGKISRRTAMNILPYQNPLVKLSVTGKQLKSLMEHSVSALESKNTPFVQVSGLRMQYDPRRPVGSRVSFLQVGGKPVVDDRIYTLACSEFLHKGGCGFTLLSKLPCLKGPADSPSESSVLIEALLRQKTIAPTVDGRIQAIR